MNMMTRVSLLCLLGVALVCQPVNGFAAFVKYYDNPTTVFSKPLNMTRKAKQPPKVAWAEIDVFQQQVSLVPLYRQPIAPVHSWLPIAQLVYFGILSTNKNTVSCWNRKFWIRFGTMRKMIRLYWPYRRRRLNRVHNNVVHNFGSRPLSALQRVQHKTNPPSPPFPPCLNAIHVGQFSLHNPIDPILCSTPSTVTSESDTSAVLTWSLSRIPPRDHRQANVLGIEA